MPFVSGVPTESYDLDTYHNSYGTLICVSDGAGTPVMHIIAGVGDIDGPNRSINVTERLTHSTGSAYKGKDPGMIDAGQLQFPVNYDPANESHGDVEVYGLGYLFKNRVKRTWWIVSAPNDDGTRDVRSFRGFVSEMGESHPVEGRDMVDVTVEIDGPITTETQIPAPA